MFLMCFLLGDGLKNSNLKGAFKRNDFKVKDLHEWDHKGYQDWHRQYDEALAKWITERADDLTPEEFIRHLNEIYSDLEMVKRFGEVIFSYGG